MQLTVSARRSARVVVVEDEAIVARGIEASLREFGHRVAAVCATGAEAVAAALRETPDLLLMDINLRGPMDGITAATVIRAQRDVPVVFLTAFADRGHLDRATAAAPYAYLVKPYTDRELEATIDVALHRHALQRTLAERAHWLATTLASLGDAVIAVDVDRRVTFLNPAAVALTGWSPEAALGRPVGEVYDLATTSGEVHDPGLRRAIAERAVVAGARPAALRPRGSAGTVAIEASASPLITSDGTLLGGVIVFRDVTARSQLEAHLARTDRLAALGTLTAGLGHELNNPLFATHVHLEFARDEVARLVRGATDAGLAAGLASVAQLIATAEAGAAQALQVVSRVRAFARPAAAPRGPVSLAAVVEQALGLADHELRHSAEVTTRAVGPVWVVGDEGQLVQVVTNLLVNAAQARAPDDARGHRIEVSVAILTDGRAQLTVRDSGVGIPPAQMVRIFEPFYTTRPIGVGNGLGLAIAHRIVEAHGGELRAVSVPGDTRFEVTLRRCDPPAPVAVVASARPTAVRRSVLVVDDDPRVLASVVRLLRDHHEVASATSAEAALAQLAAGAAPDVILCDLMMPGLGGLGFHAALAATRPELIHRTLFMTGGAFTDAGTTFVERLGDRVLSKPIARAALLARIQAVAAG